MSDTRDRLVEFMHDGSLYMLKYRDSDHSYRVRMESAPWVRYVGISTLSKVSYSDPGGLMNYAWKFGLDGKDYKEATKFTQDCGEAAHKQLEDFIATGQPLDPGNQPERVRGAVTAVWKWLADHSPTFIRSEMIVCSPSNRFAGRFDFLAEIHGELVLGDLKTTDKDWDHFRRYKAAAAYAQLAGYTIAYREMFPDKPQPTGRFVLRVGADGSYDFKRDLAPELSEQAFLSKLRTYRDDAAWDKTEKGARKAFACNPDERAYADLGDGPKDSTDSRGLDGREQHTADRPAATGTGPSERAA